MPSQLQLSAATIDDLRQKVRDEHGPFARIVSAEKVIPRGIGRIRRPAYFEAVVELADEPVAAPEVHVDPAALRGIAALLADAEDAEDGLDAAGPFGAAGSAGVADVPTHPSISVAGGTRSPSGFDELMASLGAFAATPTPVHLEFTQVAPAALALEASRPSQPVPLPPRVPGDLVAVVSLGQDALAVAQGMCKAFAPAELATGGAIKARGRTALTDRRSALLARADGVERGTVVFCAFGVEPGADPVHSLAAIDPDQVWVVVDAGRKPEDTQRWVDRITAVVDVAALAVVGAASTATPHTVNTLGIPVGWVDGAPAAAARL